MLLKSPKSHFKHLLGSAIAVLVQISVTEQLCGFSVREELATNPGTKERAGTEESEPT